MIVGVIPARYASTRFPAKPLVDIRGKSMIRRVYEQAIQSKSLDEVIVATDDARIFQHVAAFGGKVEMTAEHHRSGTERVAEVVARHPDYACCVNIQGDEPFLEPEQIDLLCGVLQEEGVQIATLIRRLTDASSLHSPHTVKAVIDNVGNAMLFSRSPIPFFRDEPDPDKWLSRIPYYKHIGIYGFRRDVLLKVAGMDASPLEQAESLEQLRWLANGYQIRTAETDREALAIDTPEDLRRLLNSL